MLSLSDVTIPEILKVRKVTKRRCPIVKERCWEVGCLAHQIGIPMREGVVMGTRPYCTLLHIYLDE